MGKRKFKAISVEKLDDTIINKIREWRNSDFVRLNSYNRDWISEEQHKSYIEALKINPNKGLYVFYLDESPFGVFQYSIDTNNQIIFPGNYLVSKEYSEMGYGAILLYFLNYIVFEKMNMRKSCGEVLGFNDSAKTLDEKFGHLEGIQRKQRLIDGKFCDIYLYGLFNNEWLEIKKKYERIIIHQISDVEIIAENL